MSVTKPANETWLSAYQPVYYGITGENGFPFLFSGVTDVDGKAQFTSSGNTYGTAPGKYLYVPSGTYAGVHTIVSVDSSGNILTNTAYISTASSSDSTILCNHIFRIWYGYPNQSTKLEVRPIWIGHNLLVDIQQFLQSLFTIQPPVPGMDINMFTHIKIQPYPAEDYLQFLVDNSLDPETIIEGRIVEDWEDFLWYVINGILPHTTLNTDYATTGDPIQDTTPIIFPNQCSIFSKIVDDTVHNIITCNGSILCPAIYVFPDYLPDGATGTPYSYYRTASGGEAPYTYSVTAGSLPDGLTLDPTNGHISGTPTMPDSFAFSITATDANGCTGTCDFTLAISDTLAELADFVARVQAAGSDVTGALYTAYQTLLNDLISVRSKICRLNLFATDTFSGIMVPIFNTFDGSTLIGNLLDTNNNFVSGDWSLPTGLQGNGTTKYLQSGVVLGTVFTQDNLTLGIFNTETSDLLAKEIGAQDGGVTCYVLSHYSGIGGAGGTMNDFTNDSATQGIGLTAISRTASNSKLVYTSADTTLSTLTPSLGEVNYESYIFASNSAGSPVQISSRLLAGYIMGLGMSEAELDIIHNAIANFNTAIGR